MSRYPLVTFGSLGNALFIAYAILKYQLLDIRVVVRRGLVYTSLGIGLVGLYLGTLLGLLQFVHLQTTALTLLASALVALTVAALFYPLRKPIQEGVEQLFLRETYAHRQMLQRFSAEMSTVLDLEQLVERLLDLVTRGLRAEKAILFLQNKSGDLVSFKKENPDGEAMRLRKDNPILTWLEKEDQPFYLEQIDILPQMKGLWESEREELTGSELKILFPIKSHGRLIGVLGLGKKQRGDYTAEDVQLMEKALQEAGMVIENALLYQESQQRARQTALLAELGRTITSDLDIQAVYQAFARKLKEALEADWVGIALIEEGEKIRLAALFPPADSIWEQGEIIPLGGTATQWVVFHSKTHYEPDLAQEKEFWTDELFLKKGLRSIVRLPLFSKGTIIGSFVVAARRPHAFGPQELEFLEQLAAQISLAVENSQLYAQTEKKAITDALTGLYNHRHFHERLDEEIARSLRSGRPFSLIMLDLDFFKLYNDTYGHLAGDQILKQVAQCIRSSIRGMDVAFRYGGEEFVVLLPETEAEQAREVAERIRKRIESEMKARGSRLTVSLGVASWPDSGVTKESLIQAADAALYEAKRTGKNRTCLFSQEKSFPQSPAQPEVHQETLNLMHALVAAIEARDPYTSGHSRKVSELAAALGKELGLPQERITALKTAALLHDVGKIGIPDHILRSPEPLSEEDWEVIKAHPVIGANILRRANNFDDVIPAVLYHHEHYDGSGYPSGLQGEEIPLEARILAIADAYNAMTSPRPYRKALSPERALEELRRQAGKQFDPKLVNLFVALTERKLLAGV